MRRSLIAGGILSVIAAGAAAFDEALPPLLDDPARTHFRSALDLAARSEWRQAFRHAERTGHPVARAAIEWQRLQDSKSGASFAEIESFLDAWPDWPATAALARRGEELLPETWDAARTRAWFSRFPPRTGPGRQRLAEAQIAGGERDAGERALREAWIDGDFTRDAETRFLGRHGALLDAGDHARRLDRLLWDEMTWAAERQLERVGRDWKRLGAARLALMKRRPGVDAAIRRVPQALAGHPGLVFERIRWRRRAGKADTARDLLLDPPADLGRPGKWWPEQRYQIREAIGLDLFKDAWTIASRHGQVDRVPFSEAEWLAGWLALRFLDDPAAAEPRFAAMYERVRFPISRARAAYWAGRAAAAAGAHARAADWFRLAARHPTVFYGQLAAGPAGIDLRFPPTEPLIAPDLRARFEAAPAVQAARLLGEAGDFDTLRRFVVHLSERAAEPGEHLLIARLAAAYGATHLSIEAARRASRRGVDMIAYNYPVPFDGASFERAGGAPEAALLLGLARQESAMDPGAVSRAGALGLMQLMPRTARHVARTLGVAYSERRLTQDPGYNVRLGAAYLSDLLADYGGARALAVAAYNAGPSRVNAWLPKFGDPRDGATDPIDWIESLPFAETRNYVQRVLEGACVYRHVLQRAPDPAAPCPLAWLDALRHPGGRDS